METRGQVSRQEWLWALGWAVAIMAVTSLPYILGAALSTPDRVFGGFTLGVQDQYSYLAKMGEGARGQWLFHIVYTSEPHPGALFFPFHILLGKLAALAAGLGGWPLTESMVAVYHTARVILGVALLLTIYRFEALVTGSRAIRKIAFVLIGMAGGLGWLLLLAGQPNWLGSSPLDLILPEAFTFLVLYGFPHIALGRTLLLCGLILLWSSPRPDSPRQSLVRGLLAGVCWLGMGLVVPFYVAVAWAVAGASELAVILRRRVLVWTDVLPLGLAGLISAPVIAYSLIVFSLDPVMRAWSEQNLILSPHPLHYVAAIAPLALPGMLGLAYAVRRRDETWLRIAAWAVVVPLLLYLPFNLQRRLTEGWQIPLALLAAAGLARVILPAWQRTPFVRWLARHPRYSVRGMARWGLTLVLLAAIPTNVLLLTSGALGVLARTPTMFQDEGEIRALDWLAERTTYQDVVLSVYSYGNYIPARAGTRTFVGLGTESVNAETKTRLAADFFDGSTTRQERDDFLRQWPITYVFAGPLAPLTGERPACLTLVYQSGGYSIFQVQHPPQGDNP